MGEKGNGDAVAEGTGMRAEDVSAPVGDPEPEEAAVVKSKSNIANN